MCISRVTPLRFASVSTATSPPPAHVAFLAFRRSPLPTAWKPFWMALTDLDAPHAWHTQFERRVFGSLISCVSDDFHIWQITYSMK